MSQTIFGHCDLDLWPSFQELLCPEHIFYIIWCRNPNFGVVIPLGMAEWCIPFWVTLTLTSGLISRFLVLYYSYLSSNVSYARPIPLGAFLTCLWHFLFCMQQSGFLAKGHIFRPTFFNVDYFLCLTSFQQPRSYADGHSLSLIRQTGGPVDQTRDPWVQGEWFIHLHHGAS